MDYEKILKDENVNHEPIGNSEVLLRCPSPAHKDSTPSCNFNVDTGLWKCHSCDASGDITGFLAYRKDKSRAEIKEMLAAKYGGNAEDYLDASKVESYHQSLMASGVEFKAELLKRGIGDDEIRKHRIGQYRGRITIPVYDSAQGIVNIRRYLPGAAKDKFLNTRGKSKARIFNVSTLADAEKVILTGGECKAIVAEKHMASKGYSCISVTAAEGTWNTNWNSLIAGKSVYIVMDIDSAGMKAAQKVAKMLLRAASTVKIIQLPLDVGEYPKGDLNDFFASGGTGAELESLIENTEPFGVAEVVEDKTLYEVPLAAALTARYVGKHTEFRGIVRAKVDDHYALPKTVSVYCDQDQNFCGSCNVPNIQDTNKIVLPSTGSYIASSVNAPAGTMKSEVKAILGIHPSCKKHKVTPLEHYTINEVRLATEIDVDSGTSTATEAQASAYMVGLDPVMNTPYVFRGVPRVVAKTQKVALVIDSATPAQDSLEKVEFLDPEPFLKFRPKSWELEDVEEKLSEHWKSLETITGIYNRPEIHSAIEIAYFSPLFLTFLEVNRRYHGWAQVLICGDSSQGKTEAFERYRDYVDLGVKVDCKNATISGLLGGLQQVGGVWFVSWGQFVRNDKKLICLEELKGLDISVLSKLTEARSSGTASIQKIEDRKAHARTRWIGLSNSRSNRAMREFAFPILAVKELIGAPEDIRRLDLFVPVVAADSNPKPPANIPQPPSSEDLRRLILWAWTRDGELSVDMQKLATQLGDELSEKYSEKIPLLDRGTAKLKLAKIASSFASLTFSGELDGNVIVREAHLLAARNYVDKLYSSRACKFDEWSRAQIEEDIIPDRDRVFKKIAELEESDRFAEGILSLSTLSPRDIQDYSGLPREEAETFTSFLVRNRCLKRGDRGMYYKSPDFIDFLNNTKFPQPGKFSEL